MIGASVRLFLMDCQIGDQDRWNMIQSNRRINGRNQISATEETLPDLEEPTEESGTEWIAAENPKVNSKFHSILEIVEILHCENYSTSPYYYL